ncbi:MAG: AtpZ/AtpI family protein [Rubrobacteraceae bacterium]
MGSDHGRLIGVGVAFIVIIAAFAGAGYFLDSLLETLPLFLLLGLFGGFASALYYLYLQLKDLGGS